MAASSKILFGIFLILVQHASEIRAAALARDTATIGRWPYKQIPVRYQAYTNNEYSMLRDAAAQVSADLGNCITFTEYVPGQARPFISVQPRAVAGVNPDICSTLSGYNRTAGNHGQPMVMFGSDSGNAVGGCLDNKRDAMRYWTNILGLLDEYRRMDRGAFMTFSTSVDRNLYVAVPLRKFNLFSDDKRLNASVAVMTVAGEYSSDFDLNSITMVSPLRYAATATPIFTIANGATESKSARLSVDDCIALKMHHSCPFRGTGPTPTCYDLDTSSALVKLNPNPATLLRSIQCSTTGLPRPYSPALVLGYFWIEGITPLAITTVAPPTATISPPVPGVSANIVYFAGSSTSGPDLDTSGLSVPSGLAECLDLVAFTGCIPVLRLVLTSQPVKGSLNQPLMVNIQRPAAVGVSALRVSLPVTLSVNCAPQFVSITAAEGIAASLSTHVTRKLSTGDIVPSQRLTQAETQTVSVNLPAELTKVVVNFDQVNPFGESIAVLPRAEPRKVFVNCIGSNQAGSTVLGTVIATDPDGGGVSYSSFSGISATVGGGAKFEVSNHGVLSVSAYADPTSAVQGLVSETGVKTVDPAVNPNANPLEFFIAAVDPMGGQSVLRAQFYLACAPTVV